LTIFGGVVHFAFMKADARKLSAKELTQLRKRAVEAVQSGETPATVARVFGVHRYTVYSWLARFRCGGEDALSAHKRGGRPPLLDAKKLLWIYDTVTMKSPQQMKFPFALWTSKMIAQLIQDKYGIRLSKASVCRLLNQLGLTPQRPVWQAYQQKPEAVASWLKHEYPAIKKLAKRLKAEIFFGDEAGVRSDHHAGTTWAKKGCTPVVSTTGARFSLNMISAVSPRGDFRFMVVPGRVSAKEFCEFIRRLVAGAKGRVFLIVDGHPLHKAGKVKRLAEALKEKFRLFYLPPYSPKLNPDERAWNDLKNNGIGRMVILSPNQMKSSVISFLRRLQKQPERVKGYFRNASTRYAA
jgi:transposase